MGIKISPSETALTAESNELHEFPKYVEIGDLLKGEKQNNELMNAL